MNTLLLVLHVMVCVVLIGVVLLQRGKGADLGAALGGGGANTIFGGRGAGNFLTKLTTASAIVFMGTSLTLAYLGTEASDVRLFDDQDIPLEEASPGLEETAEVPAADEGAAADAGGLEEIDPGTAGGLEEIDPADVGALEEIDPEPAPTQTP